MARLPKYPPRGGSEPGDQFHRVIRVGHFIRDSLGGQGMIYGLKLYKAYSDYIKSVPYRSASKKGVKRKGMSYASFRLYLYWARQLGLIEYLNPDGSVPTGEVQSEPSDVPGLAGRLYFHMVPGMEGSPAWEDIYGYYKSNK